MNDPIHVVGAAIVRDGQVLAARRSFEMSCPGQWEFPGGKIEPGESPEESLVRELEEELGVTVEVGAFLGTGSSEVGGRTIALDVYVCRLVRGEPHPREHAEIAWLSADELGDLDWAEADVPILAPLRARLASNADQVR